MLTDRQLQFLTFLKEFEAEHGIMPTYREIRDGCGFGSTNTIYNYVRKLQAIGLVRHMAYVSRAVLLTDRGRQAVGTNGREAASEREDGGQAAGGAE